MKKVEDSTSKTLSFLWKVDAIMFTFFLEVSFVLIHHYLQLLDASAKEYLFVETQVCLVGTAALALFDLKSCAWIETGIVLSSFAVRHYFLFSFSGVFRHQFWILSFLVFFWITFWSWNYFQDVSYTNLFPNFVFRVCKKCLKYPARIYFQNFELSM